MKVPPKRKGNIEDQLFQQDGSGTLNESPSEKEGKLCGYPVRQSCRNPSMKVPPKRKGNLPYSLTGDQVRAPQ